MTGLKLPLSACLLSWLVCEGAPASYIYTEAPHYEAVAVRKGGERFPAGAALHLVANGRNTPLVPGFAASADASISFDGRFVLFSGKQKPGDKWQVWELPVSGGTPRRIVTSPDDCVTPFYLPPDSVVFARRTRQGFHLETAPASGGKGTLLTYGAVNPIVTDVLRDGRVLFEAGHGTGVRELYTVYSDGSGVETRRCDHTHSRSAGRELASGDVVFETSGKLAKFTSAKATEVALPFTSGGFAGPVAELSDAQWLVSYRSNPSTAFALYQWTPGQAPPRNQVAANAIQPVVVRARTRPRIHPSSLGNREGANTLCLNVYTSKLPIAAGSVAAVRVWAQDDFGAAVALGDAPVEQDGSFYVTAPAERPVRFELLDRGGTIVAAEKGWFWYRRGEQRICVGCHAGPERAPDNAQPQALLRSTEPMKLMLPVHTSSGSAK